jgi:hypothetical protein
MDRIEALVALCNALSHGSVEVHSPGMALDLVAACARHGRRLSSLDAVAHPKIGRGTIHA